MSARKPDPIRDASAMQSQIEAQAQIETETETDGLTRRSLLQGSMAAGVLGAVKAPARKSSAKKAPATTLAPTTVAPTTTPPTTVAPTTAPLSPVPTGPGILVLVTLYGGNDGLNTVIPIENSVYLASRGALAYRANEVLPLRDGFGLHPALTGLKGLFDAGQVAIVRGVGYPNPSRSHFRSLDIWQSAVPEEYELTGWLGRWYDSTNADRLGMVSIGSNVPRALVGANGSAAAVAVGNLRISNQPDVVRGLSLLNAPGQTDDELGFLGGRVRSTGNDLGRVEQVFGPLLSTQPDTVLGSTSLEPGTAAPAGALSVLESQLNLVARLIRGGAPTRVYSVSLGGFDTHADQKANHARLLGILDRALTRFVTGLAGDPRASSVTTVVYSEFGRRVAANGSNGTDHGTAAPVFVVGSRVKGGFYGDPPPLTNLDQGDLRFTTDFRSIYSALLSGVIGIEPQSVLRQPFAPLPFL